VEARFVTAVVPRATLAERVPAGNASVAPLLVAVAACESVML